MKLERFEGERVEVERDEVGLFQEEVRKVEKEGRWKVTTG